VKHLVCNLIITTIILISLCSCNEAKFNQTFDSNVSNDSNTQNKIDKSDIVVTQDVFTVLYLGTDNFVSYYDDSSEKFMESFSNITVSGSTENIVLPGLVSVSPSKECMMTPYLQHEIDEEGNYIERSAKQWVSIRYADGTENIIYEYSSPDVDISFLWLNDNLVLISNALIYNIKENTLLTLRFPNDKVRNEKYGDVNYEDDVILFYQCLSIPYLSPSGRYIFFDWGAEYGRYIYDVHDNDWTELSQGGRNETSSPLWSLTRWSDNILYFYDGSLKQGERIVMEEYAYDVISGNLWFEQLQEYNITYQESDTNCSIIRPCYELIIFNRDNSLEVYNLYLDRVIARIDINEPIVYNGISTYLNDINKIFVRTCSNQIYIYDLLDHVKYVIPYSVQEIVFGHETDIKIDCDSGVFSIIDPNSLVTTASYELILG